MPRTHDSKPFVLRAGPLIVSVESLFWHVQRYPHRRVAPARPPLMERASPRELEQPFRVGHARIFRAPLTRRAVVLGYWLPAGEAVLADEEPDRLLAAVEGAHIEGVSVSDIAGWGRGREGRTRRFHWLRSLVARHWRRPSRPHWSKASTAEGDTLSGWEQEPVDWQVVPWNDPVIDLTERRRGA